MARALVGSALLAIAILHQPTLAATTDPADAYPIALQRFLGSDDERLTGFRALRHLEATNGHLDQPSWMEVWTEADASGFRYHIVAAGGSGYVRERVFVAALEAERGLWGIEGGGGITPDNYRFVDRGADPAGLAWIGVTPLRKDVLLVNGSIFLRPEDGDLVRIEGKLAKTPSFWTRQVEIVRCFDRIAGVRVPVSFHSTARIRFAGASTLAMTYEYESVNGQMVSRR